MILVYGAKKYKEIPRPQAPAVELTLKIKDRLNDVYHKQNGPFDETPDARSYSETLYGYSIDITDSRFAYYAERRYTHLIKLAMVLCACRTDGRDAGLIVKSDYEEAHRILRSTEAGMADALGEFGMNPMAVLKQEILEQMRAHQGPLAMQQILAMFHRDASSRDISETVNDLIRIGQVKMNQSSTGARLMSAVYSKQNTEDAMMKLLAEKD